MDSMENWLGFSLSHQEIPSEQDHHTENTIPISGEGQEDCFLPSLNLPPPFGILEAFNTSNHSQDWNVDDNYKSNSGMSIQMGSSYNNPDLHNHQACKLENFLSGVGGGGGNSFTTNQQYSDVQCYNNLNGYNNGGGVDGVIDNNINNNTTIGLSMIKNWLRSNENKNNISINDSDHVNVVNNVVNANNNGQSLSLSMSTGGGSQSTGTALPLMMTASSDGGGGGGCDGGESSTTESKQSNGGGGMGMSLDSQSGAIEAVPRKSIETFGQRTSIYRGVTRHRWTGRYEAHLWDNSCRREGQTRKGRQVYLGGYDKEEKAARSYDLAALKYWGTTTTTNFPFSDYEKELEEMKNMTRQEYVASLRRKSSGFSRGASIYRGVTRHHQHGRWQARIGRVAGNKDLYLGTFGTQEEAAEAYDIAAIKFRGLNAVTNFEINRYDVKSILESSTLPIGGAAKRLKDAAVNLALQATKADDDHIHSILATPQGGLNTRGGVVPSHVVWPSSIAFQQAQPLSMYPYNQQQRLWCKQEYDHPSDIHQDHSFHYGNTHNFFQQPHVLHNLMSLDSSSLEHSSDSNSIIYNQGVGYGSSNMNHGYVLPAMGTTTHEGIQNQVTGFGENETSYENMIGLYNYHSQQHSANGMVSKSNIFDQGSSCDNWVVPTTTTAVQALAAARRTNSMGDCTYIME